MKYLAFMCNVLSKAECRPLHTKHGPCSVKPHSIRDKPAAQIPMVQGNIFKVSDQCHSSV